MRTVSLPQRIVYLRHPQCLHNVALDEAIRSGIPNRESPLTLVGESQCHITADYLKRQFGSFDVTFASEYIRTHTIPSALKVPFIVTSMLNERNMGIWHLLERSKFKARHPKEECILNAVGYYHYAAPQGESCVTVVERTEEFVSYLARYEGAKNVLISGHGIAGLCLRQVLFGDNVETWYTYERLKNASVTVYERKHRGLICTLYNHVPWEGLIETGQGAEA